ncbi:CPBP family intramembrane glutamic endopeptidase [Salinibacterium sp. ZJ450]|uniref:CPBP family intramembrane glutamic endopeptidase n=1 Tax=Salinibacterium sp. ZJ450 TaxID=2708338 RepID=UPI0014207B99|nr:CPBP family intramembrane glutamic endopeptidase [Salinibacterium sp. ZJ450]
MSERQRRDILFSVAVHGGRFVVIMLGLWLAPVIGITGWYMGLFANALCCIYAAVLVTRLGLWKRIGFLTPWRGWLALAALVPLVAEALFWMLPDGLLEQSPGYGLWALTLLMVGFNEELISRGVVLDRLSRSFIAIPAVALTAALFGLQHCHCSPRRIAARSTSSATSWCRQPPALRWQHSSTGSLGSGRSS